MGISKNKHNSFPPYKNVWGYVVESCARVLAFGVGAGTALLYTCGCGAAAG